MQVSLDYNKLLEKVERSLSIIGKRMTNDKGELLFKDITVGSREKEIIKDYFRQGVIDLSTALSGFIVASSDEGFTFELNLPDNHDHAIEQYIQQSCEAYCVSYALYSWFDITAPSLAKKYLDDCTRQCDSTVHLVYDKRAPKAPVYRYPTKIILQYPIIQGNDDIPGYLTPDNSDVIDMETLFSSPFILQRGANSEISYTLVGEDGHMPSDDIIIRCDNPCCCQIVLSDHNEWRMVGFSAGQTIITLFSRHNDKVFAKFPVRVV